MLLPRVLIVYGTTDGHTRKIAGAIAETLRSTGLDVEVVNARGAFDPKPEDYEGVIVAASVRGGTYRREVRRWVRSHAAALGGRPTAFVSVCLGVLNQSPKTNKVLAGIMTRFFDETGWRPPVTKIVAGALLYTRYNWVIRWIMRRIAARARGDTDTTRDYEYTDWADLRVFAGDFARRVHRTTSAPVAV